VLTKILLTGFVIVVLLTAARMRARRLARAPAVESTAIGPRMRAVAYTVAGALVLTAALGYFHFWRGWHEEVTVRVINTETGESVSYRVHKGSIHQREFQTTDGWKVGVADTERIEIRRQTD